MAIVKDQAHRVVADRLNRGYADIFFTDLQRFLPGSMAFHLGAGRMHSQIFARKY